MRESLLVGIKLEKCKFCKESFKVKNRWRMLKKYANKYVWAMIPKEPATFGHVVVFSGKHFDDIADPKLTQKSLNEVVKVVHTLSSKIREKLKHLGKRVEKVYVVTICETPHLHFHLIPRYEEDNTGYAFLFEKELEETRWPKKEEKKTDTTLRGRKRIEGMEGVLQHHRSLIKLDKWAKTSEERRKYIAEMKKEIDKILE